MNFSLTINGPSVSPSDLSPAVTNSSSNHLKLLQRDPSTNKSHIKINPNKQNWAEGGKECKIPACMQAAARLLHRLDPQQAPCEDFYKFSCGNFIARNEIPDDSFQRSTLQEMQEGILIDIKSKSIFWVFKRLSVCLSNICFCCQHFSKKPIISKDFFTRKRVSHSELARAQFSNAAQIMSPCFSYSAFSHLFIISIHMFHLKEKSAKVVLFPVRDHMPTQLKGDLVIHTQTYTASIYVSR